MGRLPLYKFIASLIYDTRISRVMGHDSRCSSMLGDGHDQGIEVIEETIVEQNSIMICSCPSLFIGIGVEIFRFRQ